MSDFKRSYIITSSEVTPMEIKIMRDSIAARLIDLLRNDAKILDNGEGVVRDGLPNADFNLTNNSWVTGALVADTVRVMVNNAMANNKYAAFWGCSVDDPQRTYFPYLIAFKISTGSTLGRYQLERLYAEQQAVCYFPDPVIYAPTQVVYVEITPRATLAGGLTSFSLFSLVAEAKGPFVS